MTNRGIEEVYAKLENSFHAVEGYLDDRKIADVFKACRLKPYRIFGKSPERWNTRIHRHWIDEYGNSLRIEKKKLVVMMNDLSIDRSYIRCTDLYGGLDAERTMKISKVAYVVDELVAFVGIDDYLRVFVDGVRCSPLMFGIDELKLILASKDVRYSQKIVDAWLIGLPASKELIESLDDTRLKEILYGSE